MPAMAVLSGAAGDPKKPESRARPGRRLDFERCP